MTAVFLFPAGRCFYNNVVIDSFLSLASLASQLMLFYAYEADQSLVIKMWCRDEDLAWGSMSVVKKILLQIKDKTKLQSALQDQIKCLKADSQLLKQLKDINVIKYKAKVTKQVEWNMLNRICMIDKMIKYNKIKENTFVYLLA